MHIGALIPPNPMEELEKNRQSAEKRQLTKRERRQLKKQLQKKEHQGKKRKQKIKTMALVAGIVVIAGAGIFVLGRFLVSRPILPPIVMQNHSEQSPPRHILDQPIPEKIQKHMLEHADGNDRSGGGIIVQYNCDKFECEPNLIEKLTNIAEQYPKTVYLAPNNYDGKVILTKLGKREILDGFDERAILDFIGREPKRTVASKNGEIEKTSSNEEALDSSTVQERNLTSGNLFFSPKILTVVKYKPVKINIQNTGTHTFTIDELGVEVLLRKSFETVKFTPATSGTFEYYCSVPGHRESGQFGSLMVE